jgi:hypothetical protein
VIRPVTSIGETPMVTLKVNGKPHKLDIADDTP